MKPRTPPDPRYVGVHPKAIEEVRRYGGLQAHKPSVMDAGIDWQESWSVDGVPASWFEQHDGLVSVQGSGPDAGHWRLYVRESGTMIVGIAESLDGQALRLLGLRPRKEATRQQYIEAMRSRLRSAT